MNHAKHALIILAVAVVAVMLPSAFLSQAQNPKPTIQQYAAACYRDIGLPDPTPFPLNCITGGTELNVGNPQPILPDGKCLSPSWASTHHMTGLNMDTPFQCYGGSYVRKFDLNADVTGALLCKNEVPTNNLLFDRNTNPKFDYMAMILYNRANGKSCWFTSPKNDEKGVELVFPGLRDGRRVPDPKDDGAETFWQGPKETAAFQCWRCHDNGVWMNSPWLYNQFSSLKDGKSREQPVYGFAAADPNLGFGFDRWPIPVHITIGNAGLGLPRGGAEGCVNCHRIAAKRSVLFAGRRYVSNTLNEWLGYVTGGAESPVKNDQTDPFGKAIPADPAGSNASPAATDNQSWWVTHWMPDGEKQNQAPAGGANKFKRDYAAYLTKLRNCMIAVGSYADNLAAQGRDVRRGLDRAELLARFEVRDDPFGLPDCHWDARARERAARQQQPNLGAHAGAVGGTAVAAAETDRGLILTAQVVGSDGTGLPTISNMPPDADPVPIPSGSSLTISWSLGPNEGCFILASFPPGVTLLNKGPSSDLGYVSSGSNWPEEESPQQFGTLTEPGEYRFDLACGFQTDDEVVTQTHVSLQVVPAPGTPPTSAIPPMLMTLFTAADSANAQAVDWTSYANPQSSYTVPGTAAGEVPQTDLAVQATGDVRMSWVAENVATGSCVFAEFGGGSSGSSPINSDVGEIHVSLGSATARVFRLSCTDLNGRPHLLQSRIHSAPMLQLNVSAIPDKGVAGVTNVNITGSGFPAGTVVPANVIVELATSCGGAAEDTTVAKSVVDIIGTSKRVQFLIPGTLDPGVYHVRISDMAVGDANFGSGNCSRLSVVGP